MDAVGLQGDSVFLLPAFPPQGLWAAGRRLLCPHKCTPGRVEAMLAGHEMSAALDRLLRRKHGSTGGRDVNAIPYARKGPAGWG